MNNWRERFLTKHFQGKEFFKPEWCGEPTGFDLEKARRLCAEILEPVRERWGAVLINSGKRSAAHNASVGGAKTSDHLYLGECAAADIHLPAGSAAMRDAFVTLASISASDRRWGQVILYLRADGDAAFIHVGLPSARHNVFDRTALPLVSTYEIIASQGKRVTALYTDGDAPAYPWKG